MKPTGSDAVQARANQLATEAIQAQIGALSFDLAVCKAEAQVTGEMFTNARTQLEELQGSAGRLAHGVSSLYNEVMDSKPEEMQDALTAPALVEKALNELKLLETELNHDYGDESIDLPVLAEPIIQFGDAAQERIEFLEGRILYLAQELVAPDVIVSNVDDALEILLATVTKKA